MQLFMSGGPGAGCTSTADLMSANFNIPAFDSDSFFHKPTDPPFQEQYDSDERRVLLSEALASSPDWIVSGSIATWELELSRVQFGIFLNIPVAERIRRLTERERKKYGSRISEGGDMYQDSSDFMQWAADYEMRTDRGRNLKTDRDFLINQCDHYMEITETLSLEETASLIRQFTIKN